MQCKRFYLVWVFLSSVFSSALWAQTGLPQDSLFGKYETYFNTEANVWENTEALHDFFQKLQHLEQYQEGVVNIVHIGDSHIQADFLTAIMRDALQKRFGHAGRGWVFPYRPASTNGPMDVRFSSRATWQSKRNIFNKNKALPIGASGYYAIPDEVGPLTLSVRDDEDAFDAIEVLSLEPTVAWPVMEKKSNSDQMVDAAKTAIYVVKAGDYLSGIASKHRVSVADLKRWNKLNNNTIHPGQTLYLSPAESSYSAREQYKPLTDVSGTFSFKTPQKDAIFLSVADVPKDVQGFVLKRNRPGILYHTLGVNGARFVDYNLRTPHFCQQVAKLKPDLIILSLGTNESYDSPAVQDSLYQQAKALIAALRKETGCNQILLTMPQPALRSNAFHQPISSVRSTLLSVGEEMECAHWDLFSVCGGPDGAKRWKTAKLLARDGIHSSITGYELQGVLFFDAFQKAYQLHRP